MTIRENEMSETKLVNVRGLTVGFVQGRSVIPVVNGVDLEVQRGQTLALLGESGSGKSVTLRALMRLNPEKTSRVSGSILVDGDDVMTLAPKPLQAFRGQTISMIFQDPGLAFDPVYTIGHQIAETVSRHMGMSRKQGMERALELLKRVRIPSPERRLNSFPHELSGGMRQRAMIALALACNPKVLLADEPTTALDATVQIQILLLLRDLQRELGLAVIFVTHDIGVAVEVADHVAVMYGGKIVETGTIRDIIRNPQHPYTIGLLKSRNHSTGSRLEAIPGAPPDPKHMPLGCAFSPRCGKVSPICQTAEPAFTNIGKEHQVRCWALERPVEAEMQNH